MVDLNSIANTIMAVAAAFSLLLSGLLFYWTQKHNRIIEAQAQNYQSSIAADEMLLHAPKALRFYGVLDEDLENLYEEGISPEEVIHLYLDFKAGARYHRIAGTRDVSAYKPGHYRYTMLSVPATRHVWKTLRTSMSQSVFKQKMDATVSLLEYCELLEDE